MVNRPRALVTAPFRGEGMETLQSVADVVNAYNSGVVNAETLTQLARLKQTQASLERVLRLTLETEGGFLGVGTRMAWLVLVSLLEHHSNDLPWRTRARVVHIGVDALGRLDEDHFDHLLQVHAGRVRLVAVTTQFASAASWTAVSVLLAVAAFVALRCKIDMLWVVLAGAAISMFVL